MKLIIINGLPGTGKTTIAKPLASKLGFPLIAKDGIKEFLFDTVGLGKIIMLDTSNNRIDIRDLARKLM